MALESYKNLIVWQKSMNLTKEIYCLVKKLPQEELYSLSDQMRRAAVSIPSNISEGYGRISAKDYVRFLAISRGSNAELETQLQICVDLGYLNQADVENSLNFCSEIRKMLNTMIHKLRGATNE